VNRC